MIVVNNKESMMHAQGHTVVWRTHSDVGHSGAMNGWYQQLRNWWTAHKAVRLEAKRASLNACWDATREVYTPRRAESALEMAIVHGAASPATRLYNLLQ
jgi:hypothetical protein